MVIVKFVPVVSSAHAPEAPETGCTTVTTSYDPAGVPLGTTKVSLEVSSAVVHVLSVNKLKSSAPAASTKYTLSAADV